MTLIETNKGAIVMADVIDYAMWKSEKAWELAMRIIPDKPQSGGAWTANNYLQKAKQAITHRFRD